MKDERITFFYAPYDRGYFGQHVSYYGKVKNEDRLDRLYKLFKLLADDGSNGTNLV